MKVETRAHNEIHRAAHATVLKNLYKTYYDVPNDMAVRKADSTMKTVVDTSETLQRVKHLSDRGLHPSIIFFSAELYENQINSCVQKLHGSDQKDLSNKHT
jgi:hypothetical protein